MSGFLIDVSLPFMGLPSVPGKPWVQQLVNTLSEAGAVGRCTNALSLDLPVNLEKRKRDAVNLPRELYEAGQQMAR